MDSNESQSNETDVEPLNNHDGKNADGGTSERTEEVLLTPTDEIRPVGSSRKITETEERTPTDETLQKPTEAIQPVGGRPIDANERDKQDDAVSDDSVPGENPR